MSGFAKQNETRNAIDVSNGKTLMDILDELQSQHEALVKVALQDHHNKLKVMVDEAIRGKSFEAMSCSLPLSEKPLSPSEALLPLDFKEPCEKQLSEKERREATSQRTVSPKMSSPQNGPLSTHKETREMEVGMCPKTPSSLAQSAKDVSKKALSVKGMARKSVSDADVRPVSETEIGGVAARKAALLRLVQSTKFEYFVGGFIVLNACVIAMQTEVGATNPGDPLLAWLDQIDFGFTMFFTAEIVLRMFAERRRFIFGSTRFWNLFDSLVVLVAIAEICFSVQSSNTSVLRVVRILRLVRVVRVIRVLHYFSDLRAMVWGILHCATSFFWALVLLGMIMFLFGVYVTQTITWYLQRVNDGTMASDRMMNDKDLDLLQGCYGSLLRTMYTLYKSITSGDDWGVYADPLFTVSRPLGACFCFYIAFAVLAVLNVVTSVFVDNAIKQNREDADIRILSQSKDRMKHIENVRRVFARADSDNTGSLDWAKFQRHMGNQYVQAFFRHLELDIECVDTALLFDLLDFDNNGSIDLDEFIFGCSQLRGQARSLDLHRIARMQAKMESDLTNLVMIKSDEHSQNLWTLSKQMSNHIHTLNQRLSELRRASETQYERMFASNCGKESMEMAPNEPMPSEKRSDTCMRDSARLEISTECSQPLQPPDHQIIGSPWRSLPLEEGEVGYRIQNGPGTGSSASSGWLGAFFCTGPSRQPVKNQE